MQTKTLQMKRALRTALLALLLNAVGMTNAYAYDFSAVCPSGQILYYNIIGVNQVELTHPGCEWNPTGNITIPEDVEFDGSTYVVTQIGAQTFCNRSELTGVTIPNTVTCIYAAAFENCIGLTSINLPNSLTWMGSATFRNCTGLTSIFIPESLTAIYDSFTRCSGLEQITVDENNPVYDSRDNCNAIIETNSNTLITGCKNTTIVNSINAIGDEAFYNCSELMNLVIPQSVTSISWSSFIGCSGLEQISVNESNPIYDSRNNCNALIETGTNTLLMGCKNSTIPYTVTKIGAEAFLGCTGLSGELVIPNSVTTIGYRAFSGCTGLSGELVIPNSVTTIGFGAFSSCIGLTSVIISNSITNLTGFDLCTGITSLTIGNSVESIGDGAFTGCTGLTSVIIPNSVTYLSGFAGCTSITTLPMGNSVEIIGSYAFYGCTGLTGDLFIPNSVTEIGRSAFAYCSGLTSVFIPQSVECFDSSYGDVPFAFCTALESIIIDANNPYFDSRDNCNAIIKTSTNQLIQGCKNSIIPNSITTIGAGAFLGCTGLSGGILIPDAVTGIGSAAFYGCSSITSLTIGNSVTLISHDVFAECTNLASVTVLAVTPPYFFDGSEKDAFSGVPCTTLTVPCHCIEAYAAEGWDYHFTTIVDDCTSVAEEEENRGFVYPNPTSGQVKIEAEGLKQITISDMLGQVIYDGEAVGDVFEYDFSNNEAGVYLVRIETASGIVVKKVSVTR